MNRYLKLYGIIVMMGCLYAFLNTFAMALINGLLFGSYQQIVFINRFNEAWPEVVMIITGIPVFLYWVCSEIWRLIKGTQSFK